MRIEGQCHCGEVQFEAVIDPDRVVICHCSDCQAMSGAPYRANTPVLTENFTLRGSPKRYVKTGSSGAAIVTTFCGTCGSPIYSQKGDNPRYVNLRLGGVKQRAELSPSVQGYCRSAMPWAWDISTVRKAPDAPDQNKRS